MIVNVIMEIVRSNRIIGLLNLSKDEGDLNIRRFFIYCWIGES